MEECPRTPDFCFVHAADLHLDTPFKGIGSTAPQVGTRLREASLAAFDSLVDLCLQRHAGFLVVAGDVYDGPERGLRAQLRFRDGLARLSEAGICELRRARQPRSGRDGLVSPRRHMARACHRLRFRSGPEPFRSSSTGCPSRLCRASASPSAASAENLALRFAPGAGPGIQVGVLHCNVQGAASGYDDYSPCTLEDLRSIGLDYWALGHVHTRMILSGGKDSSEPWVVYPGQPPGPESQAERAGRERCDRGSRPRRAHRGRRAGRL